MDKMRKKDWDMLCFIKDFMIKNGYTPTIREICNGVRFRSTSTAYDHFMKMVRLGYIEQIGNRYRVKGLRFVDGMSDM